MMRFRGSNAARECFLTAVLVRLKLGVFDLFKIRIEICFIFKNIESLLSNLRITAKHFEGE